MARTKQTARKTQGGKSVATFPKQSRKVILEYSSDEDGDQRVPGVELGKPKRVEKRITLTLPTKPTNVTLTASFHQFFIRHGMNRALRKALESRHWTVDQMQQFQANYTAKHGTKIPPPKRYMDEGDSEEEGLELNDGTVYGGKAPSGSKTEAIRKHGRCRPRSWKRWTRKVLVKELEQVALGKQADQGEEVPAPAVVAATAAEVEEALQETLLETLQKTPTKARKRGCDDDDGDDNPEDDPNKKLQDGSSSEKGPTTEEGQTAWWQDSRRWQAAQSEELTIYWTLLGLPGNVPTSG